MVSYPYSYEQTLFELSEEEVLSVFVARVASGWHLSVIFMAGFVFTGLIMSVGNTDVFAA